MMRKLIAALLIVPSIASAEFLSGNDLYHRLTSNDSGDKFYALGYIVGAYDMGVHVSFCPRTEQGITAGQVQDIVRNYLAANPGFRQRSADWLVREALKQVWPCANNTKGRV